MVTVALHLAAAATPHARQHLHLVHQAAQPASRALVVLGLLAFVLVAVLVRTAVKVTRGIAVIANAFMQVAAEMTGLLLTVIVAVVLAVALVLHR